jgi:hypothetical protein
MPHDLHLYSPLNSRKSLCIKSVHTMIYHTVMNTRAIPNAILMYTYQYAKPPPCLGPGDSALLPGALPAPLPPLLCSLI